MYIVIFPGNRTYSNKEKMETFDLSVTIKITDKFETVGFWNLCMYLLMI